MNLTAHARTKEVGGLLIGRISTGNTTRPTDETILWWPHRDEPPATRCLAIATSLTDPPWTASAPLASSIADLDYLADGDVISIAPNGFVRVLYRRSSPHNTLFVTDQCNSFCLMCSQPPKRVNDFERINDLRRLVSLIDVDTTELGITGGEPTLFGDGFLGLIRFCKERLPRTALHVLTNGRMFYYRSFAVALGEIAHPNLMIGIPLYSDVDHRHDYVVQAAGAFAETIRGVHHLSEVGVPIELRVVIHRQTYDRLPQVAAFIARNLPFVHQVALMGLEPVGFTLANMASLWIDPLDYAEQLLAAVDALHVADIPVRIYNHQLCVVDRRLWPYAVRSISDWKNIYLPICNTCSALKMCGGFFASAVDRHSRRIRPITTVVAGANR